MSDINSNNAYEHPNQNPENFERWKPENIQEYKEAVYDKISALLIEKLSQIDGGGGIQSLQKTYKDGLLVTGKSSSDVMVVYESDVEANADDRAMDDTILNWLDFAPPEQLTLTIETTLSVSDGGEDQVGALPPPDFILHLPDRDLNINKILGTFNIDDVNLKDNVSQFMGFSKSPPNISRSKLLEYVDGEISELNPITFTQFLEEYNKAKKRIPFYRHRTDDFFNEYGNSIIPIEYRIEKFFEEFARIKDQIPAGSLAGVSSTDARTEGGLFGYRTMTYLLKEARVAMDDGEIPEWSVNQVISFMDEIDNLDADIITKDNEIELLKIEIEEFKKLITAGVETEDGPEVITGDVDIIPQIQVTPEEPEEVITEYITETIVPPAKDIIRDTVVDNGADKPPRYRDSMGDDNVPFKDEIRYPRGESTGPLTEEESSELPPVFRDEGEFDRFSKGGRTRPIPRRMRHGRKTQKMSGGGYSKGRRIIQAPKGRKATRRRR